MSRVSGIGSKSLRPGWVRGGGRLVHPQYGLLEQLDVPTGRASWIRVSLDGQRFGPFLTARQAQLNGEEHDPAVRTPTRV